MSKIDDILSMPPDKIRRIRIGKKNPYEQRVHYSRQELVDYLVRNQIKSSRQLIKTRGVGDPVVFDYVKEFGSWSEAKKFVFGDENPIQTMPITPKYMVQTVLLYGLWTEQLYRAARYKHPDIVPSLYRVARVFGSYKRLKLASKLFSYRHMISAYFDLKRRIGKAPSVKELSAEGIDMGKVIEHFKTRQKMLAFFAQIERIQKNA